MPRLNLLKKSISMEIRHRRKLHRRDQFAEEYIPITVYWSKRKNGIDRVLVTTSIMTGLQNSVYPVHSSFHPSSLNLHPLSRSMRFPGDTISPAPDDSTGFLMQRLSPLLCGLVDPHSAVDPARSGSPVSPIRNPQSAIHNPQSGIPSIRSTAPTLLLILSPDPAPVSVIPNPQSGTPRPGSLL